MEVHNRFNPKFITTKCRLTNVTVLSSNIEDSSIVDYIWAWTLVHYHFFFFFFEKQHFDEYYKGASKSARTSDEIFWGTGSIQTDNEKDKKALLAKACTTALPSTTALPNLTIWERIIQKRTR